MVGIAASWREGRSFGIVQCEFAPHRHRCLGLNVRDSSKSAPRRAARRRPYRFFCGPAQASLGLYPHNFRVNRNVFLLLGRMAGVGNFAAPDGDAAPNGTGMAGSEYTPQSLSRNRVIAAGSDAYARAFRP